MDDSKLNNYTAELQTVWNALVRRDTMPAQANVIVVGGCSDLGLAEKAAELYHAGVSNVIVITGYQPEKMSMTEARYLADKCGELGVPQSALILEEEATNTGENIVLAAKAINDLIGDVQSVILVHKPYVSLRFLATAEAQWPAPQPKFYATCQTTSFEEYCKVNGLEDTAWKLLGDIKRMDTYVEKGYQTAQLIPQPARNAYDKIINSGYITR